MAVEAEIRRSVRPVIQALRDYAAAQGWGPDDYRIYLRPNLDWGYIKIILVAKAFPSQDRHDNFEAVTDFLEKRLKDGYPFRTGVVLRTFDEVQDGFYSIPSTYYDADDL
jgi:hypothetical protein